MDKSEKKQRNKDAVQLKKIGFSIFEIEKLFKINVKDLNNIIKSSWDKYTYPTEEEVKSIELRRDLRVVKINSFIDNGNIIEVNYGS